MNWFMSSKTTPLGVKPRCSEIGVFIKYIQRQAENMEALYLTEFRTETFSI